MRELVVQAFISLDGVVQAPGGPEEDPSGGFEHGGWAVGYWDGQLEQFMGESMGRAFDLVLGRKTYEIFAAHWPHTDEPGAAELNNATKHVASRTLTQLDWQNSHLLEDDVPDAIRALKQQDGPELQVYGSANLIQTLLAHDLVDELRLLIFPLVLGKGKRLFDSGAIPTGLEQTSSQTSSTGVLMTAYRTGTDIKSGSFALDDPTDAELARGAKRES